jgi:hypothetical protein
MGGANDLKMFPVFEGTFRNSIQFGKSAGYGMRVYFGGADSPRKRIEKTLGQNVGDFTEATFQAEVSQLREEILQGVIPPGAKILLIVDTHGSPQTPTEVSHSIFGREGSFSMDPLRELSELALAKGIRLGIIDHSCYSGAT